ncbi:MAG: rod shape-determining protein MreD [Oligoflexia bacterium]|nr:rod shape-determining protein MreD [Oligoflexia bacterium]
MLSWRAAFLTLLLGIPAVILQGSVLKSVFPDWPTPGFLISIVAFLSFYEVTPLGAVLAFLLGLELDISTGVFLGPWAGAYVVTFVVFSSLSQRIFVESGLSAMVIVFISSLLSNLVFVLLMLEFKSYGWEMIWTALFEALLSALFAPLVLKLLRVLLLRRDQRGNSRSKMVIA